MFNGKSPAPAVGATLALGLLMLLGNNETLAATDLVWDVGKQPATTAPIKPGEYRLVVRGLVFGANYTSSVSVEALAIQPLAPPGGVPPPFPATRALLPAGDPCDPPATLLDNLLKAAHTAFTSPTLTSPAAEEAFANARSAFASARSSLPAGCEVHPEIVRISNEFSALEVRSERDLGTYTLERGQKLQASISRLLGAGPQKRDFSYERSTGKRGAWIPTYGIGIIPNNDEHFFSRSLATDSFEIAQKRDNGGVDPTAAVFYTWLPSERENSDWNWGIAAGIGADKNNVALFLGPHITFNQNVGLVGGVALHQETRLRGEYEVGQVVTENLTSDALEEKVNEVTWFIALTLRFGAQ